jgi:hypothetical protein
LIGNNTQTTLIYGTAAGYNAQVNGMCGIAIGSNAIVKKMVESQLVETLKIIMFM